MKDIYTRLDEILPRITEADFRKNKGLANEIKFYIFDYNPEYELFGVKRFSVAKIIRVPKKINTKVISTATFAPNENFLKLNFFLIILKITRYPIPPKIIKKEMESFYWCYDS